MVNTGKPSGGCKLCRARRIKCDERKPFCMRCEKSKRQCPGYRDPFETKIRDETAATINKFAGRAPRDGVHPELQWVHYVARQGQWEQPTPPPEFFEEGFDYDELVNQICASLTTPVDQQASCHFLSDFVLLPSQPKLYGYHRYIFGLLQRDRVLPAFESAFKCVSFASLSRRPNCKPLQLQAQALYIKALKEVSRALNDPTQAKSDQLLGAVLLLAVYETLTMDLPTTQGYSTHLRGAAMLMKASGPELHKTREGNEMWELAKTQILIFRQMPGAVLDDYSWLLDRNRNNPNISHTVNQMTMDRYAVRQETDRLARMPQTAEVVKELNEVLAKAQQLLAQMRRSPLEPLSEEPTEGINAIDDSKSRATTFPGTLSHFATFHSALIYLASMLSQVLLTTCIFRILAALHGPARYKSAKGYDDTVGIVTCCLRRIISATPFFLQWSGKDRFQMTSSPCGGGEAADESPMRGGIGSMIQWPLFVGFVSDFATREQKIYLRGRLRHLSEEIRVKQASAFLAMEHHATPSSIILEDLQARGQSYPTPSSRDSASPPASESSTSSYPRDGQRTTR